MFMEALPSRRMKLPAIDGVAVIFRKWANSLLKIWKYKLLYWSQREIELINEGVQHFDSLIPSWAAMVTDLSRIGCQGRFPSFPMPRLGHTATIPFRTRDMENVVWLFSKLLTASVSRQHNITGNYDLVFWITISAYFIYCPPVYIGGIDWI